MTADWFWGNRFYLTGKTSFATLIGSYKNEALQQTSTGLLVGDATYEDHRFSFHSQAILGPSWQMPCECWSVEIFAGYEFNIWLNLQEILRSDRAVAADPKVTRQSTGLFGLQGLTTRLTIGF